MEIKRSFLFVPGNNLSIIRKATFSDADCVIIDLEDAVAQSEKVTVRETVKEALLSFGRQKDIIVRINDISTPYWKKDLAYAVENGAKGVMMPKAESADGVRLVCQEARKISKDVLNEFEIIPLIETAKGVQFAYLIAAADTMILRMAFGSIDFSLDIDCELTPNGLELLYARSQIVTASKAAGINAPIDAVYPDLSNEEGLEYEAKFARQVGFKAKLIIHPKQIPAVHSVFTPSETEIKRARDIVLAFEEAEKNGIASIKVQNQLVDYPVYKKAKSLLALSFNR